jgi:pyroglutamyl-peptidase
MRTLLTGFGPFGTIAHNPSARIVEQFARVGSAGHQLTCRVLPVSFARAEAEVRSLLTDDEFDLAILLGVAGRDDRIRLERYARLRAAGRADVDGAQPASYEWAAAAPDTYLATIPPEAICDTLLSGGFPAYVSDDAGSYVCNHAYYAALHCLATTHRPTRCLFVHVPPDAETHDGHWEGPTMPLERQLAGVALVLGWLAEPEPGLTVTSATEAQPR